MNAKTTAAVQKHGERVKAVFGLAADIDPMSMCRKLRKLEREGEALGLRLCNGPEYANDEADKIRDDILNRLDLLLGFRKSGVPVFINRDPRGYALKIKEEWMRNNFEKAGRFHRDFGGYGIIAPDLSEKMY